jgi:four helix bundle protein
MGEYKFQNLLIYQLALEYINQVYDLVRELPEIERYNLSSQLIRAATSIALNIAEGSTGLSNKEQIRFLNLSIRSYLETVASLDIIQRRNYISQERVSDIRKTGKILFYKVIKFRKVIQS